MIDRILAYKAKADAFVDDLKFDILLAATVLSFVGIPVFLAAI